MLIRAAEVQGVLWDVRIAGTRIAEMGQLIRCPGEPLIEACGGALLPGLHDHHIHLAATAARRASIPCGPPGVVSTEAFVRALQVPGSGWLRGTGFHESVLGGTLPDVCVLDRIVAHRPVRIQHATGRMWLLNSLALEELLADAPPPPGLERKHGRFTGRLFDEDAWLQEALGSVPPDFMDVSAELARHGVTGITDMSPANGTVMARHFTGQVKAGRLLQSVVLAGSPALSQTPQEHWRLGPLKLHLHEAALPDFDTALALVQSARAQGRTVAVHCVTEVELVFALALLEAGGARRGDRIEHVSVASPDLVERMAGLGLAACVQPHFIAERGDRYLAEVDARHIPDLYRLNTLIEAGIAVAGGSDAPYGSLDPWAAMTAALRRTTPRGTVVGMGEAISPEAALDLYLADPLDFRRIRRIAPGEPADLCLLDRSWSRARHRLDSRDVAATIAKGRLIHQAVDQPPFERLPRADAAAG